MIWQRHRNGTRSERQAREELLRWLSAEAAEDEADAERALGALFTALPAVEPPPGLSDRVLSATVWAVEPTATEVTRGWWRAVVVLAGLAGMTILAGSALAPRLIGLLDPAAALARSVDGLLALVQAIGGWLGTAANLFEVLPWLGSAMLLVASTPQAVVVLALACGLTALAIKVLHQVVERDRRLSYVETN